MPGMQRGRCWPGSMPGGGLWSRGYVQTDGWMVSRRQGGAHWVKVVRRWRKFYATNQVGWVGHRHRKRVRLLAHLALGLVAYGLIELQREGLKLSFYQCRRKLMARTLTLDLSPLEAA